MKWSLVKGERQTDQWARIESRKKLQLYDRCSWLDSMKGCAQKQLDFPQHFIQALSSLALGIISNRLIAFGRFQGPFLRSHFQTFTKSSLCARSFILISSLKALGLLLLRRDFCLDVVSAGGKEEEACAFTLRPVLPHFSLPGLGGKG